MKAVLFDLGGTLIDTAEIFEIWRRILEAHGIERSLDEISLAHKGISPELIRISKDSLRCPKDYPRLFEFYIPRLTDFYVTWNLHILKKLKIRKNVQSLARTIAEQWWDHSDVRLYPDAEETLKQLKNMGLKVGLVTNGFQSDIDQILPRVGLTNFFDVTVGADAVGKTKPNREIFLYALKKLGIAPQETLFVGDQMETDYEGARKAGLKALLIDREDKIRKRVKKIKSLKEITAHLER